MDAVDEHVGDDASIGVAANQLQFDFLASHQTLQSVPRFGPALLTKLRRVDVGKADIHLLAGGIDDDAVAILDANDLLRTCARCGKRKRQKHNDRNKMTPRSSHGRFALLPDNHFNKP